MFFPSAEPTITYKLCGESLETAKEIHELTKESNKEYEEVEARVRAYSESLMAEFNAKYNQRFSDLLLTLAQQLGIPHDQITFFHLEVSYLDDHNIAFLKHCPKGARVQDQD